MSDSFCDSTELGARLVDGAELLPPGTLVAERYRIGAAIGEGGMCTVFLARDRRLARDVALKLLNPRLALSREIIARFVNEARALAQLDSPHVVRVYDAGVVNGRSRPSLPFMVLELLHGTVVRNLTQDGVPKDRGHVVGWMLQACEGLAAAHAEGIIHRDLKPENLFIAIGLDGSECVKILDFGVARWLQVAAVLTMQGEGVGSPGYMSPEQLCDASDVDVRTDIWALGVVMYELIAGVAPFQASSSLELCAQILRGHIAPIGTLRPDLPRDLAVTIMRCLERNPERRFPNVAELADALAPHAPFESLDSPARVRRRLTAGLAPELAPEPENPAEQLATVADEVELLDEGSQPTAALPRRSRAIVAHTVAFATLAALLSFLTVVLLPVASERSRAFVEAASARLSEAARGLFAR